MIWESWIQDHEEVFEELSFSRLIVVPLFFIDFVGVRKENERLTAIPSSFQQQINWEIQIFKGILWTLKILMKLKPKDWFWSLRIMKFILNTADFHGI